MYLKNRREFLRLCATSASALAGTNIFHCEGIGAEALHQAHVSVSRYIDPLPLLKRVAPRETRKDKDLYIIRMMECTSQMHSQLPPTHCWGFEGQYPGPIIEATRGRAIEVEWENRLPATHIFKVDTHIHGAMPPAPEVRTVPHLHGARTRSEFDGLPEKWFTPGSSARYFYENNQQAATLWYHDHAVGITRLNVYAGLSGFYLLHDDQERRMNLPSGDYEIPLLLQDRTLDEHGQLVYAPTGEVGQALPPGVWGPEFFGELPVVNGAIYPYLEVEPRLYRLRLLNGANSRFFNLSLNLAKRPTDIPSLVTFHQIGTDGGFLPKPAALTKLLLGPAERADLIVDFSGLEDKTVTLSNDAGAPFPGWSMLVKEHPSLYELMQFRVTRKKSENGRSFSMPSEFDFSRLDEKASVITRDFVLSEWLDEQGQTKGIRINNKGYDDPVTESVKLGTVEKWRFINTTDDAHPMHLHLVQFQVLHRQGFNTAAFTRGVLEPIGIPRPPEANEAGWKDTAIVNPRDVLTILARFEGYTGKYVFHCHMLEHEDNDMMRPYEVI
ncbi:multicopper oxidase family protein [Acidobacterium sp. S8]|uniref:multicopper oxidase family protein n=1 Tax=Acidobacterium sp. S8 TaxID=1641854 RepID=UPI0020B13F04|nr:multicopper oxidase family protein [Acidobacterium sp. S8]